MEPKSPLLVFLLGLSEWTANRENWVNHAGFRGERAIVNSLSFRWEKLYGMLPPAAAVVQVFDCDQVANAIEHALKLRDMAIHQGFAYVPTIAIETTDPMCCEAAKTAGVETVSDQPGAWLDFLESARRGL